MRDLHAYQIQSTPVIATYYPLLQAMVRNRSHTKIYLYKTHVIYIKQLTIQKHVKSLSFKITTQLYAHCILEI